MRESVDMPAPVSTTISFGLRDEVHRGSNGSRELDGRAVDQALESLLIAVGCWTRCLAHVGDASRSITLVEMTEQGESNPYSDRELMLQAISMTFERASAAQAKLVGTPTSANVDPDIEQIHLDDTVEVDSEALRLGTQPGDTPDLDAVPLPNQITTDKNFAFFLDQATAFQGDASPDRGARSRVRSLPQLKFNAAVVQALHQLDHRTRLQEETIAGLEAELGETRRALAEIKSDERGRR